jgi:hypothetical protein
MARLGEFEYPDTEIHDIVGLTRQILAEDEGGRVSDADLRRLGDTGAQDKTRSTRLIRDAVSFGAIKKERDGASVTDLGRQLAEPRDMVERRKALAEAAFSVPILKALAHAMLGRIPPEGSSLVPLIASITQTHVSEAAEHADAISKLYEGAMRSIGAMRIQARSRPPAPAQEISQPTGGASSGPTGSVIEVRVGRFRLQYPLSKAGLSLLVRNLEDKEFQRVLESELGDGQAAF